MNFLNSIGKYLKHGKTLALAIGAITAALFAASEYWEKNFPTNEQKSIDETTNN